MNQIGKPFILCIMIKSVFRIRRAERKDCGLKKTVSVIGGDLRALTLARLLEGDGFGVSVFGFDREIDAERVKKSTDLQEALAAEVIILPIPTSCDLRTINAPFSEEEILLDDFFSAVGPSKLVLGGHIRPSLGKRFDDEGIAYIDYSNREEFKVKNAVPTAEGAIGIALSELPVTLSGATALVVGYGRIGKILTRLLVAMGADTTVSARRWGDLAWIETDGAHGVHTSKIAADIDKYDVIFNTVPTMVIGEEALEKMKDDALIIDLASVPGGLDIEAAKELSRNVIWALSLPGKTAPISAGKIICDTVKNILEELEAG